MEPNKNSLPPPPSCYSSSHLHNRSLIPNSPGNSNNLYQSNLNHHPSNSGVSMFFATQIPIFHFDLNHGENEAHYHHPEQQEDVDMEDENMADHPQCRHYQLDMETMFEKPLTPSDVGKLNRLVIPKQHAEKYFPLSSNSIDKGLLLSFEDESGKCWRFRYSYWNSSQSYVLTKGWSRYVKDNQLDAGDVVFFLRHRTNSQRLFVGWRKMVENGGRSMTLQRTHSGTNLPQAESPTTMRYDRSRSLLGGRFDAESQKPALVGTSKTLRLFGVDMECNLDGSDMQSSSSISTQDPLAANSRLLYSHPGHFPHDFHK